MRLPPLKTILWPGLLLALLSLFAVSCDKDLTSAEDQPRVDYILEVVDSLDATPLDSVTVKVRTIAGDTLTRRTLGADGRIELPTVNSSRTWFTFSRNSYRTLDVLDTVDAKPDTIFNRALQRQLRVRLVPLKPGEGKVQALLSLQTEDLATLRRGRAVYRDSLEVERTAVDEDSNGTVELRGLRPGRNRVRVVHSAYLSQFVDVTAPQAADSARTLAPIAVILLPLKYDVSGQVFYRTATENKPLLGARVVFEVRDTLAAQKTFETRTETDPAKGGYFLLSGLPALPGRLLFYRDGTSQEYIDSLALSREDVLRDGNIRNQVLTIPQGSGLKPEAIGLPGDTLAPGDSLVFRFNQAVATRRGPDVRLINTPQKLWIRAAADSGGKILKAAQEEGLWQAGKEYAWELAAWNEDGEPFTAPGDTAEVIRGTFYVKETKAVDSNLVYPEALRIVSFNSGKERRYDSADAFTSPLGDSTTRFVRLKWGWKEGGNRVDTLRLLVRDGGSAFPNWTEWLAIPGVVDSVTLDFAELYSTSGTPNQKPVFPLRLSASARIEMKAVFVEGRAELDSQVTLPAVTQGMGPSVWSHYESRAFKKGSGDVDSILVTFRRGSAAGAPVVNFGSTGPEPRTYVKTTLDTVNLEWTWTGPAEGEGRLHYTVRDAFGALPRLRVDLHGIPFDGKPIWHRNRQDGVDLD